MFLFERINPIIYGGDPSYQIDGSFSPHFALITNTESCLPDDYFGYHTVCDCHIYVTSFRNECRQNKYEHIEYIFNNTAGWSAGRNLGYKAARKRHNYLYYILLDDDVGLEYNTYTPKDKVKAKVPPMRLFMDFLLDMRPAIATAGPVYENWKSTCHNDKFPPYVIIEGNLDARLNAFHRDVTDVLLPYYDKFERTSVWLSQVYVVLKMYVMYHKQIAMYPNISNINRKRRPYPRGHLHDKDIRRVMVNDLKAETPIQYQNHPVFEHLLNLPNVVWTGIACEYPPPPSLNIIPYRQMYGEKIKNMK